MAAEVIELAKPRSAAAVADAVYKMCAEDYPDKAISWIKSPKVRWEPEQRVDLSEVDYSNKTNWKAYGHDSKIKIFVAEIKKGYDKPILLVRMPGKRKLTVIDGHHRALAWHQLNMPVNAYVCNVGQAQGPWAVMHDMQNMSQANAAQQKVAARLLSPALDKQAKKLQLTDNDVHALELIRKPDLDEYIQIMVAFPDLERLQEAWSEFSRYPEALETAVKLAGTLADVPERAMRPATSAADQENRLHRSVYLANVYSRLVRRMQTASSRREDLTVASAEVLAAEVLELSNQTAQDRHRLNAAELIDGAAETYGSLLGWYTSLSNVCSEECRQADGHNFYADKQPFIGYPGFSSNCRCAPGKPFETGPILLARGMQWRELNLVNVQGPGGEPLYNPALHPHGYGGKFATTTGGVNPDVDTGWISPAAWEAGQDAWGAKGKKAWEANEWGKLHATVPGAHHGIPIITTPRGTEFHRITDQDGNTHWIGRAANGDILKTATRKQLHMAAHEHEMSHNTPKTGLGEIKHAPNVYQVPKPSDLSAVPEPLHKVGDHVVAPNGKHGIVQTVNAMVTKPGWNVNVANQDGSTSAGSEFAYKAAPGPLPPTNYVPQVGDIVSFNDPELPYTVGKVMSTGTTTSTGTPFSVIQLPNGDTSYQLNQDLNPEGTSTAFDEESVMHQLGMQEPAPASAVGTQTIQGQDVPLDWQIFKAEKDKGTLNQVTPWIKYGLDPQGQWHLISGNGIQDADAKNVNLLIQTGKFVPANDESATSGENLLQGLPGIDPKVTKTLHQYFHGLLTANEFQEDAGATLYHDKKDDTMLYAQINGAYPNKWVILDLKDGHAESAVSGSGKLPGLLTPTVTEEDQLAQKPQELYVFGKTYPAGTKIYASPGGKYIYPLQPDGTLTRINTETGVSKIVSPTENSVLHHNVLASIDHGSFTDETHKWQDGFVAKKGASSTPSDLLQPGEQLADWEKELLGEQPMDIYGPGADGVNSKADAQQAAQALAEQHDGVAVAIQKPNGKWVAVLFGDVPHDWAEQPYASYNAKGNLIQDNTKPSQLSQPGAPPESELAQAQLKAKLAGYPYYIKQKATGDGFFVNALKPTISSHFEHWIVHPDGHWVHSAGDKVKPGSTAASTPKHPNPQNIQVGDFVKALGYKGTVVGLQNPDGTFNVAEKATGNVLKVFPDELMKITTAEFNAGSAPAAPAKTKEQLAGTYWQHHYSLVAHDMSDKSSWQQDKYKSINDIVANGGINKGKKVATLYVLKNGTGSHIVGAKPGAGGAYSSVNESMDHFLQAYKPVYHQKMHAYDQPAAPAYTTTTPPAPSAPAPAAPAVNPVVTGQTISTEKAWKDLITDIQQHGAIGQKWIVKTAAGWVLSDKNPKFSGNPGAGNESFWLDSGMNVFHWTPGTPIGGTPIDNALSKVAKDAKKAYDVAHPNAAALKAAAEKAKFEEVVSALPAQSHADYLSTKAHYSANAVPLLTQAEIKAIGQFQGTSSNVNPPLWNINVGTFDKNKLSAGTLEQIKALDSAMQKWKLPKAVTVRRGIDHANWLPQESIVGKEITENGFSSTSFDKPFSGNVEMWIRVPQGMPAVHMNGMPYSSHTNESELLLPRGIKLLAIKDEKLHGKRILVFQAVIPNPSEVYQLANQLLDDAGKPWGEGTIANKGHGKRFYLDARKIVLRDPNKATVISVLKSLGWM